MHVHTIVSIAIAGVVALSGGCQSGASGAAGEGPSPHTSYVPSFLWSRIYQRATTPDEVKLAEQTQVFLKWQYIKGQSPSLEAMDVFIGDAAVRVLLPENPTDPGSLSVKRDGKLVWFGDVEFVTLKREEGSPTNDPEWTSKDRDGYPTWEAEWLSKDRGK